MEITPKHERISKTCNSECGLEKENTSLQKPNQVLPPGYRIPQHEGFSGFGAYYVSVSALRSSCIPDDRKLAGRVYKQTKKTNTFQRQVN